MKTRIIFFFLIIVASCIQAQVRMVAGQPVLFEKQDVIDLATYNWPRTLISYVVVFDGGVKEEMLSLTVLHSYGGHTTYYSLSSGRLSAQTTPEPELFRLLQTVMRECTQSYLYYLLKTVRLLIPLLKGCRQ